MVNFISFVVVGMRFRDRTVQDVLDQDSLVLVHDKDNAHDPMAIAVYSSDGSDHLGYITRDHKPDPKHFQFGVPYKVNTSSKSGQMAVEVILEIPE